MNEVASTDVLEVNHPNRQLRHKKGKSDTIDAESYAGVKSVCTVAKRSGLARTQIFT